MEQYLLAKYAETLDEYLDKHDPKQIKEEAR